MAGEEVTLPASEAIGGVTKVNAKRIGLLSDDHNSAEDGRDLPDEVFKAFAGCDLIVHLGHMGVRDDSLGRGVLDRLQKVAPVLAVRDYSGKKAGGSYVTPAEGDRVKGLTRVIETAGVRIGALHNLSKGPGPEIPAAPGGVPELKGVTGKAVAEKFGGPVNVVAFASTHRAVAQVADGVLFVNPGSPTYPKGPGRAAKPQGLGTVGILEIADGVPAFEIVELSLLTNGPALDQPQTAGSM